jgi:ribosomal protein S18 acetylase RimI-like enzyme
MDIHVRLARLSDPPDIVALLAEDRLGRQREKIGRDVDRAYIDAFLEMRASKTNLQLVAEDDQGIVGCLQLTFIRGLSRQGALRAVIEGVRVASRARGRGIGQQLVCDAIERARAAHCSLVQLTSDKRRTSAQAFYRKLGFVASHEGMKLELSNDDAADAPRPG